jgi:hypothetical protein
MASSSIPLPLSRAAPCSPPDKKTSIRKESKTALLCTAVRWEEK